MNIDSFARSLLTAKNESKCVHDVQHAALCEAEKMRRALLRRQQVDTVDLRMVSFAFASDVCGRRYTLERRWDRAFVGAIEANVGNRRDAVAKYWIAAFVDGTWLDGTILKEDPKRIGFSCEERFVGECKEVTEAKSKIRTWEFAAANGLCGIIRGRTHNHEVTAVLDDGQEWRICCANPYSFRMFINVLQGALTALLLGRAWCRRDNSETVIPNDVPDVDGDVLALCFALQVTFRMHYYAYDFD